MEYYNVKLKVAVTEILNRMGLWNPEPTCQRSLPWINRSPSGVFRASDEVRPIFWSIRPKSYVCRTSDWDQFPNGRWGNSSAPSFGDLKDYHIFYTNRFQAQECREQWGSELSSEEDIWRVFECFVSGEPNENGVRVVNFPWCEDGLATETLQLKDELVQLNRLGILTINSQPNVNGAASSDPVLGWGAPDGYVYQKAYLEFFMSKDKLPFLLKALEPYPRVQYHIIDKTVSKIQLFLL